MRCSSSGAVIPRWRAGDRSPEDLASSPLSILTLVFGSIPIGGPPLPPLDPRRFCAVATVNSFASAAAIRLTLIVGGLMTGRNGAPKPMERCRTKRAFAERPVLGLRPIALKADPEPTRAPTLLPIAPGRNLRSTVRTTPARDRAHRGEK